jgi:D-alanyl-D-alanine carboxypeptidase
MSAPARAQALSPAEIDGAAALVFDRGSDTVLWSKNAQERRAMASTTKIMTALLVIELIEGSSAAPHYTTEFTASASAYDDLIDEGGGYGSPETGKIEVLERLSVWELLQAMLIPSDNYACYILAESLVGSTETFVLLMNSYAAALGLRDTRFHSPNGFDHPEHYTTAADLAALAELAMQKPIFRLLVADASVTYYGTLGSTTIAHTHLNSNRFLNPDDAFYDPEVIGIKTGTTGDAGACLVAAAERGSSSLLTVVLGSDGLRFTDTRKLLDYGWDRLSMRNEATSYAAADFDGDGYEDLAVGIPQASAAGASGAGKVALLQGSASGIKTGTPRTLAQGMGAIPSDPQAGDGFGHALAAGDFNGDGYGDLAVGAPWEDVSGQSNAGNVTVVYGAATGLDTATAQGWNQGTSGVPGLGEAFDHFGQSLAAGDFDGDGYDDLAIGIPGEDVESEAAVDAGGVVVLHGGPTGLSTAGARYFHQSDPTSVPGAAEDGDSFGASLAAGRFDGDRFDDLAVGVPGEDVGTAEDAGMVCVLYGSSTGLDPDAAATGITDDDFGPSSVGEPGDQLGYSLAVGDFDEDGHDDLAAGAPGENYQSTVDCGAVLIVYGASGGLADAGSQFLYEGSGSIGAMAGRDAFGAALHASDFDGDGDAELAIGIPGEDDARAHAGAVVVLSGSSSGLATSGSGVVRLEPGASSEGEFGSALGGGRFGSDGIAGLAVAIPDYTATGAATRGATRVFDGQSGGLVTSRYRTWSGL